MLNNICLDSLSYRTYLVLCNEKYHVKIHNLN